MAAAIQTRAEKIDDYVREALSSLLSDIGEACGDTLDGALSEVQVIAADVDGPLFGELWPEDKDTDGVEHELAHIRSTSLRVAVLVTLTTAEAQESLRAEASRLSQLIGSRAAEIAINEEADDAR